MLVRRNIILLSDLLEARSCPLTMVTRKRTGFVVARPLRVEVTSGSSIVGGLGIIVTLRDDVAAVEGTVIVGTIVEVI